jgi:Ti-type conjugative transfer relaxase TraA
VAIQFARARYISRSTGGNAVRSAAYNQRTAITSDRTGELFSFKNRDAPEHHEVLLPKDAAAEFASSAVLWNSAEAAEKRKDAQVAREIVLALPANPELSNEDRIELARSFAAQHFAAKGLAVQLDAHAPHEGDSGSERANWHAHLLITTRRVEGARFAAKKARDLDPDVRRAGGRAIVTEGELWGELWRDHQNRYFVEHGLGIQVDPVATHAEEHIGPVRMRKAGAEIVKRTEMIRQANKAAARDPDLVLATLTQHNATFSERDLDRHLTKQIADEAARAPVRAAVLGHAETLALYDPTSGEAAGRYTTRSVRAQEQAVLADAAAVAGARHQPGLPAAAVNAAATSRRLRGDQRQAFDHAVAAGGLKIVEGRAGTGKSYVLQAVREAHERAGRRVVGLGPTNTVVQDLRAAGFAEAATVHATLFALKNGRTSWDRRTVVIIDEAAMLSSTLTGALLVEARQTGTKMILAGDDRQLASIERGGLFSELRERHGSAAISEIVRQRADWQRNAARDLAEGRFADALAAFHDAAAITWTADQTDARRALLAAWKRDTAAEPEARRFVFAYTNRDVDALNAELRQVRRDRGELSGRDVRFETKHGAADFAQGDRVQITETQKRMNLYNGNVGTITGIDAKTGVIRAELDAAAGQPGRKVAWVAFEFKGFRHGYAGTIYKGQGRTLDHTYIYHTHHWNSAASYVGLTRQRESAQVFVARETARDVIQLARQMAREEIKAASIAWATKDELAPASRERVRIEMPTHEAGEPALARAGRRMEAMRRGRTAVSPVADPISPLPHSARHSPPPNPAILIPAFVDPAGLDSLGRGLDAGSIAAAVAADRDVQREREALPHYLRGTYSDPYAAKARLDEMVKRQGWTSSAARIAQAPTQLGALRGKLGLFASAKAKAEHANAVRVGGAIAPSLERIGAAEARAAQSYRASVEAQHQADATPIPKLTAQAEEVAAALAGAKNTRARSAIWRAVLEDRAISAELQRFSDAVQERLGEKAVRTMLRGASLVDAASVPAVHRTKLATVCRTVRALGDGGLASKSQTEALRLGPRQTPANRRGLTPQT